MRYYYNNNHNQWCNVIILVLKHEVLILKIRYKNKKQMKGIKSIQNECTHKCKTLATSVIGKHEWLLTRK